MATTITGTTIDVNTAVLNRLSTDGTIVDLQKDGTSVGSIGSSNGAERLYMVNDSTGLSFLGDFSKILPCDSAGAPRDAAIDLGQGSGGRFKDLHLSGGVYLGGTGAANKLDDYEEGTWTPTIVGGTLTITTINKASYIKVGNIVHINLYITLANNGNSNDLTFGGLPFAAATGIYGTGVVTHAAGANSTETLYARANEGSPAQMQIYKGKSNGVAQTDVDGGWFITSLSYRV